MILLTRLKGLGRLYMKKQVEDWFLLADDDLRAAEIILNDESHLTNI